MALEVEGVVDGGMHAEKALCCAEPADLNRCILRSRRRTASWLPGSRRDAPERPPEGARVCRPSGRMAKNIEHPGPTNIVANRSRSRQLVDEIIGMVPSAY
jgi:hypothetical protein